MLASAQTVTISVRKTPLAKIFSEIEKQTGYRFVYRWELVRDLPSIDLDVKSVPIKTALDSCLRGQPLKYNLVDNTIVLSELVTEKTNPGNPPINVSGVIRDKDGDPLEGATLKDRYRGILAITNSGGEFVLQNIDPFSVVEISYIGYVGKTINIANRTSVEITLDLDINSLDETVVKGYYNSSRRLSTGTVGKVTAEQISRQPVSNPLAALQGRVPGLLVTQSSGLPGSTFNVLIRGRNSIQSGNAPLYVVDGVPFSSQRIGQLGETNASSPFNSINPLDIESIEVLKDADATAIYGSRGANGVILITTKKGKAGESSVQLTARQGWGKITRFLDLMNTQQYRKMRYEAFTNDGLPVTAADAYDLLVFDSTKNTDWKDLLIGGTAKQTTINAKVSGGSENTRFTLDGGYFSETSVFPVKFGNERKTVSLSVIHKGLNDRLHIQSNVSYAVDDNTLPYESPMNNVLIIPNAPGIYDSSGKFKWEEQGYPLINPIALMQSKQFTNTERITSNLVVSYELFRNLVLKSNIGYNTIRVNDRSVIPIIAQDPAYLPTGAAVFGSSRVKTWIAEPQLEYSYAPDKRSKLQLLLGTTFQENFTERNLIYADGYTNDNLLNSTAGATSSTASASSQLYHYAAVFGRINYQFDEKYLVNLTGRRDGSSRFGPNNRFTNFGAVGLGWIFSKEKLLLDNKALSFGKLRFSYGITGNDQIGEYQYLDTWTAGTYPYQGSSTLRPTRIFNSDYVWESNRKLELSLDLGFRKDRILVTANWFYSKTTDPIVNYNLPSQTGFNSVLKNFPGTITNQGWEIELTTRNIQQKNFEWTSSFNITIAENKLESFPGLEASSYASSYRVGKPLNAIIGFQYLGINPQTGKFDFADLNKDNALNNLDYVYGGTTNPRFYGGFQNSLRIKNWTVDVFIQFSSGKNLDPALGSGNAAGTMRNQPVSVINNWPANGNNSTYQKYTTNWLDLPRSNISRSNGVLTEASFARLKNISLSRNFTFSSSKRRNSTSINVFVQAQNIFTVSDYVGADPESAGGLTLPPIAMATVGIQLSL